MEIRIQRILLKPVLKLTVACLFLLMANILTVNNVSALELEEGSANKIFDPQVERREVEREAIDTENWEIGAYYGVISIEDFGSSEIQGARIAYHITEDFFIETSYGKATAGLTSFERLNGNVVLLTDKQRDYAHFNVSLGFNILPGEGFIGEDLAFTSSLYLLTGLGSTKFAGEQRSTIMVGGGYRVLFTDWFAMHLTLKEHMYDIELLGNAKTAVDLEISTGFTIYF
jgi:outer membrane beta-barrel protein